MAQSSLESDRTRKKAIYASEDVPEYWIVDLEGRAIEVYREPDGETYSRRWVFRRDTVVTSTEVAGVSIPVSEVVPPPDKG